MITAEDWAGEFGDAYTERQMDTSERRHFWQALVEEFDIKNVLEVGCNAGENLKHLNIYRAGVDVNEAALAQVPEGIRTTTADATDLPYFTDSFDLVFTFGVLIHIPPEDLEQAMKEIIRVSRGYVFCGEYFGHNVVPYREGALWRRPYGLLYKKLGLELVDHGHFEGEPWDRNRIDWWLLKV